MQQKSNLVIQSSTISGVLNIDCTGYCSIFIGKLSVWKRRGAERGGLIDISRVICEGGSAEQHVWLPNDADCLKKLIETHSNNAKDHH